MSRRAAIAMCTGLMGLVACSGGGDGSPPPVHQVSGTVRGVTQAGVTITLAGAASAAVMTDAAGSYRFESLPSGAYTLTPSKAGFTFDPASRAVTVADGDSGGHDFTAASAVGPPRMISGTVSGATGVTVTLSGASTGTTTTDAAGAYRFMGLANGSFTVTPRKAGHAFDPPARDVTVASADSSGNDFVSVDLEWANWRVPQVSPGSSAYQVDVSGATVRDGVTGLVWQRVVSDAWYDWAGAKSYCASLGLGDWPSGWRLPTLIELASLPDFGRYSPAIDLGAFPSTPPDRYWTSTADASLASYAWAVNFRNGETVVGPTSNSARARCVRLAPAAKPPGTP